MVLALTIGMDSDDDPWFETVLLLGIAKRWVINVDTPENALITLELEGL